MLSIGDYLAAAGLKDVTGLFRGSYDTEEGAQAHLDANGGCAGLIDMTGAQRISEPPRRGDVAVVQGVGAICTGEGFALRLDRGVVEINARFVKPEGVWGVGR